MAECMEVVGEKDDIVDSYCSVGDMLTMEVIKDKCRSNNESDALNLKKFRHPLQRPKCYL